MKRLTTLIQLLLFASITTGLSAELKSYRINSFEYYRLIDFLRLDSDIKAQIHPLRLTALIKKNNTESIKVYSNNANWQQYCISDLWLIYGRFFN